MNLDLTKVSAHLYIFFFLLIISISSGFLFLFIFCHSFFTSTDNFRLSAISMSIISPVFIYNSLIGFHRYFKRKRNDPSGGISTLSAASIYTIIAIYLPILIAIFRSISFKEAIIIVAITEVLITIWNYIEKDKKNTKTGA
jgi:hypothetical protein